MMNELQDQTHGNQTQANAKIGVGPDKLTNVLFWCTFLHSLFGGCLRSVLCADDNASSNDVLFYGWKIFSETVVLLLVMLFSDRSVPEVTPNHSSESPLATYNVGAPPSPN